MEEIYKKNQEMITKIVDMRKNLQNGLNFYENQLWKCDKTMRQNENTKNQNTVDKNKIDNDETQQTNT